MSQTRPWTGWASCLLRHVIPCFPLRSGFVTEGRGMDQKCRAWRWNTHNFWEFLLFSVLKLIAVFTGYIFVYCWWSPKNLTSGSYCVNDLGEDNLLSASHEPKLSVGLFWCHFLDCRNFQNPDHIVAEVNSLFLSEFVVSCCEGNWRVYTSVRALRWICLYFFFKVSSPKTTKTKEKQGFIKMLVCFCLFFFFFEELKNSKNS